MQIQDNGVLCSCGEFHIFSRDYYIHPEEELIQRCKGGMECVLWNKEIIKINKKDQKKEKNKAENEPVESNGI